MSEIVTIEIDSNAKDILRQVRRLPAVMAAKIAVAMNAENYQTLRELTLQRMNFPSNGPVQPNGLRRQSGTAVRSLRVVEATIDPIKGDVTSSVGTNLVYVRAQEEGYIGTVGVRAYTRRSFVYGPAKPTKSINVVTKLAQVTMRRSRRVVKDASGDRQTLVSAHTMNMNLPARHFMRDTFAERSPNYGASISAAIKAGWDSVQSSDFQPIGGGE